MIVINLDLVFFFFFGCLDCGDNGCDVGCGGDVSGASEVMLIVAVVNLVFVLAVIVAVGVATTVVMNNGGGYKFLG